MRRDGAKTFWMEPVKKLEGFFPSTVNSETILGLLERMGFPFASACTRVLEISRRFGLNDLEAEILSLLYLDQIIPIRFLNIFSSLKELAFALDTNFSNQQRAFESAQTILQDFVSDWKLELLPEFILFISNAPHPIPRELREFLNTENRVKDYEIWPKEELARLRSHLAGSSGLSFIFGKRVYENFVELNRAAELEEKSCFRIFSSALVDPIKIRRIRNCLVLHQAIGVLISESTPPDSICNLFRGAQVCVLQSENFGQLPPDVNEFYAPDLSQALWRKEIESRNLRISEECSIQLESIFPFSLDKIEKVLKNAFIESNEEEITFDRLAPICRHQSSRTLESFAKKISPKYKWEDLILPPDSKIKLKEIYDYIRSRAKVETEWGFRSKHNRGHGVVAVFEGQSGTGKTMAAEVLASELGMDLYQVDLANLNSKYIGETEKNISKIFSAAKESSGILLFDEGDGLFSRRSEVNSSNDKYSNLETNFLLQEIESFDGIIIISTNFAHYIDQAFLRRISFQVHFPRPDVVTRFQIWKSHLETLPHSAEINFDFLSRLPISGGLIKNIVRQSAAYAARDSQRVEMHHLLHSIKREFQKVDLPIEREVFPETYWKLVSPDWDIALAKRKNLQLRVMENNA